MKENQMKPEQIPTAFKKELSVIQQMGYLPNGSNTNGVSVERVEKEDYDRVMMEKASKRLGENSIDVGPEISEEEFLQNLERDFGRAHKNVVQVQDSIEDKKQKRKAAAAAIQVKAFKIRNKQFQPDLTPEIIASTQRILETINKPSIWVRFKRFIAGLVKTFYTRN